MLKQAGAVERFRVLADALPYHVWTFRADGSVGYCNQQLVDYTGLTREQLRFGGWAVLHPDDVARVQLAWRHAWSKGAAYEQQQRLRGADGQYRHFLCRAIPMVDEAGHVVEWLGTNFDIESRVPGEEPLRLAMQRLAEQLGQTGTSLEKLFRQQTGSSVHAYLVQARLHHAARLILEGQKIEAVGLEVGYRSKKNFYQQFVRMFGMTPGAYRAR